MAELPEIFVKSYASSAEYPCNLLNSVANHHSLVDHGRRLRDHDEDLFCDDSSATIDVRELKDWEAGSFLPSLKHVCCLPNILQASRTVSSRE